MRKRFGILAVVAICIVGALIAVSWPIATHSVSIDLPADSTAARVDPDMNAIEITSHDQILWNGHDVTLAELEANLRKSTALPVEPELRFEPDPSASYDLSAKVLGIMKEAKVTKFGFVGNEKYTVGEAPPQGEGESPIR